MSLQWKIKAQILPGQRFWEMAGTFIVRSRSYAIQVLGYFLQSLNFEITKHIAVYYDK
jgi:hypothetical protein